MVPALSSSLEIIPFIVVVEFNRVILLDLWPSPSLYIH
jgi:hypothetical protein